jgi:hypothetical protein
MSLIKRTQAVERKGERGSALILTIVALANALIIVTFITAISTQERKMNEQLWVSTPAFQLADSGIEHAVYKLKDPTVTKIGDLCSTWDSVENRLSCYSDLFSAVPGEAVYLYFVDDSGNLITSANAAKASIKHIRSVAEIKKGDNNVTQAVQVTMSSP